MRKALSKVAIAASVVGMIYAAPAKAQEHAVSTGTSQTEVKGAKKTHPPITSKEHKGAETVCGKDMKCAPKKH